MSKNILSQRCVKNILVTGGAGFIGSAFIRYLLEDPSYEGCCINLDVLTYAGNLDNLHCIADDPRYVFRYGNICDEKLIESLVNQYEIDTIIHFAAESHVDRSILDPSQFIQTNIVGTYHLLEVVRRHPSIHFHHVSTDEVYGSLGKEGYFSESTSYSPNSPYSASKASSDHFVRAYAHTYGISTCISNCSNNYGPYQFPEKLIPLMIQRCLEKKPLTIHGDGRHVRDWLYVDDHAKALLHLLKYGKKSNTYAIGGNAERTNLEVLHEIIELISVVLGQDRDELKRSIVFVKDRPGNDLRYAIDFSKIKEECGWAPSCSFSHGLQKTICWYVENQAWMQRIQSGSYQNWMASQYIAS